MWSSICLDVCGNRDLNQEMEIDPVWLIVAIKLQVDYIAHYFAPFWLGFQQLSAHYESMTLWFLSYLEWDWMCWYNMRIIPCLQIHDEAKNFAYQTGIRFVVAYGGALVQQWVWHIYCCIQSLFCIRNVWNWNLWPNVHLLHCVWYWENEWVMIDWCMCTVTWHWKRCGYFGCNTWMIEWFIGESQSLIVNGVLFGFGWGRLHVGYGVWASNLQNCGANGYATC